MGVNVEADKSEDDATSCLLLHVSLLLSSDRSRFQCEAQLDYASHSLALVRVFLISCSHF